MAFRFAKRLNLAHAFSAMRGRKTENWEKNLLLEVLALKVPFRNLLLFPNQAPWPGRFVCNKS